jgi:hypothetical protein
MSNCPTILITTITLTSRITLMTVITSLTLSRNNQTGITNNNINFMRVEALYEHTITQIKDTYEASIRTHKNTRAHEKSLSECLCDFDVLGVIRVWQDRRISKHHSRPRRCRGQPWRRPAPGRRPFDHNGRQKWVQSFPGKCVLKLHTPRLLGTQLVPKAPWRIRLA